MTYHLAALVPVYNNPMTIERTLSALLARLEQVIVVDDGSDDETPAIIARVAQQHPGRIDVVTLASNQGKGAAVQAGFHRAAACGITHVLQVDADGQHDVDDVPTFIAASEQAPAALVLGVPVFDDSIPAIRKHGRKLTKWMIVLETGSTQIPDAMCGYRVYPVQSTLALGPMSRHMNFDPEALVRAVWAGIPLVRVPTHVAYLSPEDGGVSHFRMVRDNILNVLTHTALLLQSPWRLLRRKRLQR
ncbi:MAG: glycosyltransferase family 2 protein [Gammaproteobacteria bacterium]|nr:glycosyltransferase family 2 protein [Gammaproteobacteria bacterium]